MDQDRVDSLIVYGLGALSNYGPFTYLTGHLPSNKGLYAVIRQGEAPVIIAPSTVAAQAIHADDPAPGALVAAASGIGREAYFETVIGRSVGAVGIVAPTAAGLPYADYRRLVRLLGAEPHDSAPLLSEVRRWTDQDDVQALGEAVHRAQRALEAFGQVVRVGDTEQQAAAAVTSQLKRQGSRIDVVHVCAGVFRGQHPTTEPIAEGSVVTAFAETAGSSGHWAELGAVFLAGEVSDGRRKLALTAISALSEGASLLREGAQIQSIAQSLTAAIGRVGHPTIGLGHSTGVDEGHTLIEASEEESVRAGDTYALHPSVSSGDRAAAVAVANTFVVAADGPKPFTDFPHHLHQIPAH
ncbi:hypothetical protein SRABI83_00061 [Arthrobacter sp. Bi83]|uniref:M24 family metallopeptidase n=1 Tax=Arthrobacter sp. Bi83 TaxID=2822353 RepID=UPI001D8147F8|nr:M24 family metallopeptidase [Arthrobacter sp. Bi83]CAH0125535.1 hypothetical protein SRABI83_00061 [Arthrobacter sp. Bi83]